MPDEVFHLLKLRRPLQALLISIGFLLVHLTSGLDLLAAKIASLQQVNQANRSQLFIEPQG